MTSADRSPPATRYRDFVNLVRRHSPAELLPALARVGAAHYRTGDYQPDSRGPLHPWSVSAAARESIAWGGMYRSAPVRERDLARIGHAYAELRDPYEEEHEQAGAWLSLLTRLAFEQLPYQQSVYAEIARVQTLFDRGYAGLGCKVLSREAWQQLLGVDLGDFLGIAFLLSVSAQVNDGWFNPAWLGQANFQEIVAVLPAEMILEVFHRVFVGNYASIRASARATTNPNEDLRRLDPNPLRGTPFVAMPGGGYLAPQPHFVTQRISPASLYYLAAQRWGNAFTSDLGLVTEAYVGEHLSLLGPPARHVGEVEYRTGERSVDHFLLLPGLTVLIEVKSARVGQPGRLDLPGYLKDAKEDVGKALGQIDRTADLIRGRHPAFGFVPANTELRGLVVTAEPHYLLNSPFFRDRLTRPTVPTVIAAMHELERLAGIARSGNATKILRDVTAYDDQYGIDLGQRLESWRQTVGDSSGRNPLLQAAWATLPWNNRVPEIRAEITADVDPQRAS